MGYHSLGICLVWPPRGLIEQGLSALESHMIYQLRFVLRSYSQETHEANEELLQRHGVKSAKMQILKRLRRFIKRQEASSEDNLTHLFLPRARQLESKLNQLQGKARKQASPQETLLTRSDCGAIFIGTGALRRHSQRQHPDSSTLRKGPKFDQVQLSRRGSPECLACGRTVGTCF